MISSCKLLLKLLKNWFIFRLGDNDCQINGPWQYYSWTKSFQATFCTQNETDSSNRSEFSELDIWNLGGDKLALILRTCVCIQ